MDNILESAPKIIVNDEAEAAVDDRIRFIDRNIHEFPDLFIKEFIKIGELVTEDSTDLSAVESTKNSTTTDPGQLILEYFKCRYDLDSTYDDATENAIDNDEAHQNFIKSVRRRNFQGQEAIRARDACRRSRFSIYLGRVLSHEKLIRATAAKLESPPEILATSLSSVV